MHSNCNGGAVGERQQVVLLEKGGGPGAGAGWSGPAGPVALRTREGRRPAARRRGRMQRRCLDRPPGRVRSSSALLDCRPLPPPSRVRDPAGRLGEARRPGSGVGVLLLLVATVVAARGGRSLVLDAIRHDELLTALGRDRSHRTNVRASGSEAGRLMARHDAARSPGSCRLVAPGGSARTDGVKAGIWRPSIR